MYIKFFKRLFDILFSLFALILLSPLLIVLILCGTAALKGNPFFLQLRPGAKGKDGKEKIFKIIKLRTMTYETDKNGTLLSDDERLVPYGKFLRDTSLDELFELVNILKGDMSLIGPRPQLIKDLVFMTDEQRNRHNVRPGLSGLAQVNGRNAILWEDKFNFDLQYLENITFAGDIKIMLKTVKEVFNRDGIMGDGTYTGVDFGDYLLNNGTVTKEEYDEKLALANGIAQKVTV